MTNTTDAGTPGTRVPDANRPAPSPIESAIDALATRTRAERRAAGLPECITNPDALALLASALGGKP